jgi:hypothetical protein
MNTALRTKPPNVFVVFLLSFLVTCSLVFYSCKKNNPVAPGPAQPDSTSQDFTWEEISIGNYHSYLRSVFALNDTDVWAAGQIQTLDQFNRTVIHNALHWNGKSWTIIDVPALLPGTNSYFNADIYSVFAFGHNDVWFACGGIPVRWDGKQFTDDQTLYKWFPYGIYGIWGKNNRDVYLVGGKGSIAHYDGGFFRLNSGITEHINDVWGAGDTAFCTASNWSDGGGPCYLMRLVSGKVDTTYSGSPGKSIWLCDGMSSLIGAGKYCARWDGTQWRAQGSFPLQYFQHCVRGNSAVDYFVADDEGGVAHFNGKRWASWRFGWRVNRLYSITCTQKNVWAVGTDKGGVAYIVHGNRK